MSPFATAEELRLFVGNPSLDSARAQLILDGVSDAIRGELGWSVTEETDVELTLDGRGSRRVFLPTLRLTAVSSVTEEGAALVDGQDFVWSGNGTLTRIDGDMRRPARWSLLPRSVVVVFSHGYPAAEIPGVFRTVTLEHAAKFAPTGQAVRSERVGVVQLTYADVMAATTAGSDPRLAQYRNRMLIR